MRRQRRPAGTRYRTRPTTTCSARAAMARAIPRTGAGCAGVGEQSPAGARGLSWVTPPRMAPSCAGCHNGVHHALRRGVEPVGSRPVAGGEPGRFRGGQSQLRVVPRRERRCLRPGVSPPTTPSGDRPAAANYLGRPARCATTRTDPPRRPTGKPLEGQLRFPIDVADANQNLCMKCHQRRSQPDSGRRRGPHSPQGPMLLGDAGYKPAGFEPDIQAVASTHGSERTRGSAPAATSTSTPSPTWPPAHAGRARRAICSCAIPCLGRGRAAD